MVYTNVGPGQEPAVAISEATMLKVMGFCDMVRLPGVNEATGLEFPLVGGQFVISGSHKEVQAKVGESPETFVRKVMGRVLVALQMICWVPGEDWVTGTGFTLNIKSAGTSGEQPAAVGKI